MGRLFSTAAHVHAHDETHSYAGSLLTRNNFDLPLRLRTVWIIDHNRKQLPILSLIIAGTAPVQGNDYDGTHHAIGKFR